MTIDAAQLVSTSNLVRASLAREPELDEDAAISELVESGKKLDLALHDAVEDGDFWVKLQTDSLSSVVMTTKQADNLAVFAAAQHVAILELLGYRPPPPAQEFVDETVEALQVLRDLSPEPFARQEEVVQAREALRVFNARLRQLLQERGAAPLVVRRSLLRRALHRGARIALALAPLALAYGAKLATEAVLGVPGDAVKDIIQGLVGAVITMIPAALPEAQVSEREVAAVLGEIDGKARVRALASVVQARLLKLNVVPGLDQVASVAMISAVIQLDSAAKRHLRLTGEYKTRWEAFVTSLRSLEKEPSEQNLGRTIRAWAGLQATLDQMESRPSDFDSRMQELARGQERREKTEQASEEIAAEEPARMEEHTHQPKAAEQITLEEQERQRIAAAQAEEERRQRAEEEARRKEAQRGMTMEQGS